MTYRSEESIFVGAFFIAPGIEDGKVWIGRAEGGCAGEGGDFSIEKLEEVLRKFYEDNF